MLIPLLDLGVNFRNFDRSADLSSLRSLYNTRKVSVVLMSTIYYYFM